LAELNFLSFVYKIMRLYFYTVIRTLFKTKKDTALYLFLYGIFLVLY